MVFRPSLACNATFEDYKKIFDGGDWFLASPKLDGIRALVINGQLVSRTLKPIRNRYIQEILGRPELEGLDGELIVGSAYGEGVFARTSSGVMSEFGEPNFTYFVFDNCGTHIEHYDTRYKALKLALSIGWDHIQIPQIHLLHQEPIYTLSELEVFEEGVTSEGYEGAILRHPASPYKQGRSTLRERYMLKLKRFLDSEAQIIGFQELRHNDNEATVDARGYTVHSSHKDNKVGMDTLGALRVRDIHTIDWEFNVGTGFDQSQRQYIWDHKEDYLNKIIKYKYLPIGTLELPRHPVYLGLRDTIDR